MSVKPFVKWAGGKSRLLPDIRNKYPKGLGKSILWRFLYFYFCNFVNKVPKQKIGKGQGYAA